MQKEKSRRSLKIMRIIARLNVGGPAIHVSLLTEKLDRTQFEQVLVCGQIAESEGDMQYYAEARGIQPIIIPELGREISFLRDINTLWKVYRLIRKYRPDIVHTHTAKAGFIGRVAAGLARVPIRLHTFHGHVFHGYFSPAKTRFFIWLERFCARLSTRIIAISPKLKDELVERYHIAPVKKFDVLPLGLDLQPLTVRPSEATLEKARQALRLPVDKKLVGIIGRLVPIKNHDLFLRVAREVITHRQDVHFVIVGDGECREELEHRAHNMGLADYVTFTGWVQDIGQILHQLSVVALTSNNEGTPVSLIEAMAAGIPIIATNVGGVADTLEQGKYGVLVPADQSPLFSTALLQILDGRYPDLETIRQAALARYHITRLVKDMEQLYLQLAKEKGIF